MLSSEQSTPILIASQGVPGGSAATTAVSFRVPTDAEAGAGAGWADAAIPAKSQARAMLANKLPARIATIRATLDINSLVIQPRAEFCLCSQWIARSKLSYNPENALKMPIARLGDQDFRTPDGQADSLPRLHPADGGERSHEARGSGKSDLIVVARADRA
jgi:hypothetical protein